MTLKRRALLSLLRLLLPAALCALQWAPAGVAAQEGTGRGAKDAANVLVINGADAYLPAFVAIDSAMRAAVEQRYDRPVIWLYETLDALRFGADAVSPQLAELIAKKYGDARIDVVVLVTEPAVDFYLRHRERLWPQAAVVFHSVPSRAVRLRNLGPRTSGIAADQDYGNTLRIAFSLQPRARRLVVVAGTAAFDQAELEDARKALQPYAGRVQVESVVGLSLSETSARLARETGDTIVLFTTMFRAADGNVHTPRAVLEAISAASGAPVYGAFDSYVGGGIAAGAVEPFRLRGEKTGELVVRALQSAAPIGPLVLPPTASQCVADGRQLERFGLRAAALPAGCEVRFVEAPFFERYWWQSLLVLLALVAQSVLIASLLLQSRRRRVAELSLQSQRVQLLHASRLAVAGELTASIAHEINQPLGAILSNADAAEMLIASGRMQREELLQILGDIRRDDLRASEVIKRLRALLARHDTERRRFSVNRAVEEAAALLRAEARRRAVALDFVLGARRADVIGDVVQIQQVIINLILNAFDASAELAEDARRVRVETSEVPGGVQASVRDFGAGIAPSDLPRVFDSFFSTKRSGMGLGLSIARSIVEAHGGTIAAARCEAGAEFRMILPLAPDADRTEPPSTNLS
jgi:signal transduction histidine kinase